MIRRTDVVVPAHLVPFLRIPPLAVTDATGDPEWVPVPMSIFRFRREPAQRLPLDRRAARRARRFVLLAPWTLAISLVAMTAHVANYVADLPVPEALAAIAVGGGLPVLWNLMHGQLPRQTPQRYPSGDLRIPYVPYEVAQEWTRQNPGVTISDEPAPRPHPRRFYAAWSGGLVLAASVLAVVLATNNREDHVLLQMAVVVLFLTGVSVAWRLQAPTRDY